MAVCGAKTRTGGACQRRPLRGKKRCALHGGKSTGPRDSTGNRNAAKPGSLYSKFLSEEETQLAQSLELGQVDEELRLTRIRLLRALAREQDLGDTLELYETIERTGGGENAPGDERKCRVQDYALLIDRLTSRIESLESRRQSLLLGEVDLALKRFELERRRKEHEKLGGSMTHNIVPVPTADSVEGWEAVAERHQNKVLGR
ncbi:HGGxSTG domain-containing protein [Chromobacterium haemolyticum]|uniref:HGGxSTG domain-containing protein n=1 Tax=Chromobacterium haemolyticum TaxID=394935 RepID=UPI0022B29E00|nr:HGGxSTG domain-containing protein [Chromobacterium haemolyticum]